MPENIRVPNFRLSDEEISSLREWLELQEKRKNKTGGVNSVRTE